MGASPVVFIVFLTAVIVAFHQYSLFVIIEIHILSNDGNNGKRHLSSVEDIRLGD